MVLHKQLTSPASKVFGHPIAVIQIFASEVVFELIGEPNRFNKARDLENNRFAVAIKTLYLGQGIMLAL